MPMLILTNFERFPASWTAKSGRSGSGVIARTAGEFIREARRADLVMINCDTALTMRLCAWFLLRPWRRTPIVVVDIVLRMPKTSRARAAVFLKKLLLRRVTLFIHYFEDITGY